MSLRRAGVAALPALAALSTLAGLLACHPGGRPVADLASDRAQVDLAYPETVDLDLTLTPRAARPTAGDLLLFVHLLDEPGSVVRTFDLPLDGPWKPGEAQRLRVRLHQSALAEPLPPGDYLLAAGLYAPGADTTGERFTLGAGHEIARQEYRLATVRVPSPAAELPRFRFSDRWLPAEPGTDRQVLARRWLAGGGAPGELEIGPLAGPGALWIRLEIPAATGGDRVEVETAGEPPRVAVTADCGGFESVAAGSGPHDFELAIPAGAATSCRVAIDPNFRFVRAAGGGPVSVALEILAWGRRAEAP